MSATDPKITKFDVAIGKALKKHRTDMQVSQRQLGSRLRNITPVVLNQARISRIEAGIDRMSLSTFLAICQALEISPVVMLASVKHDFSPAIPVSEPVLPSTKPHTPSQKA